MTDVPERKARRAVHKAAIEAERAERLRENLRANLKRRKSQAKERKSSEILPENSSNTD